MVRRENGLREEAGTSAKAELNDNEYEEVTKEMKQGFGKPVKRRQPKLVSVAVLFGSDFLRVTPFRLLSWPLCLVARV